MSSSLTSYTLITILQALGECLGFIGPEVICNCVDLYLNHGLPGKCTVVAFSSFGLTRLEVLFVPLSNTIMYFALFVLIEI